MLQNFSDLLPLRAYSEHAVLQFYSQNGTGVGGRFVVAETGNNSPELTAGGYSATPVGASFQGTLSNRYENARKVKLAGSGDSSLKVLGITLYGTAEYDANGQRLILNPQLKKELCVVTSGESTPIATDGYFRIKSNAYSGTPIPGYVGVIHPAGGGILNFVTEASLSDKTLAVCKVLSSSGSAFGGYADIKLTLK